MKKSNVIILCVLFLVIGFALGSFLKMVVNNSNDQDEAEIKENYNYADNEEDDQPNNIVDAEFNG